MLKHKGLFVTVDGPNGVGKSSVVDHLTSRIHQLGHKVISTSEPTTSDLGQLIRKMESVYEGRVYACLVASDRYYHLDHEIIPALQEGTTVLCSRYVESSLVLQRLDGVNIEFIWTINSGIIVPDLSVILTSPVEILEKRLSQRSTHSRFEQTKTRLMELNYYMDAAEFLKKQGFNILILDNGNNTLENTINRIYDEIQFLIENGTTRQ
jgi:dTMP kinase